MSSGRTALASTLWQKAAMAITGLLLFGFVLGHMAGNLKTYQGSSKLNAYAEHLRELGAPIFDHGQFLWVARGVLLLALVIHVVAMISLTLRNRAARPIPYAYTKAPETSEVSRTMIVTGPIILVFVIFHLLHFTTGQAHPNFRPGDVYANVVTGFRGHFVVVGAYVVALLALGTHLFHGLWSLFQTLGLNHTKWNPYRGYFAAAFSALLVVGFLAVPIGVVLGLIR